MKRVICATALVMALALLCGCGKKKVQPVENGAAANTIPVEGVTALTLSDGEVTLRFASSKDV